MPRFTAPPNWSLNVLIWSVPPLTFSVPWLPNGREATRVPAELALNVAPAAIISVPVPARLPPVQLDVPPLDKEMLPVPFMVPLEKMRPVAFNALLNVAVAPLTATFATFIGEVGPKVAVALPDPPLLIVRSPVNP